MNTKQRIALVLAALCLIAMLTGCAGKQTGAPDATGTDSEPASGALGADVTKISTVGEALALEPDGGYQSATTETAYVYVFKLGDTYWRMTAALTPEQFEALQGVDITADDHEEKERELLSPVAVTKWENLNEQIIPDAELQKLVGKTGAELVNDGWSAGMYYDLENLTVQLEQGPFAYEFGFEAAEAVEASEDADVLEVIRPLTVKSVAFDGLGNDAAELPENAE